MSIRQIIYTILISYSGKYRKHEVIITGRLTNTNSFTSSTNGDLFMFISIFNSVYSSVKLSIYERRSFAE